MKAYSVGLCFVLVFVFVSSAAKANELPFELKKEYSTRRVKDELRGKEIFQLRTDSAEQLDFNVQGLRVNGVTITGLSVYWFENEILSVSLTTGGMAIEDCLDAMSKIRDFYLTQRRKMVSDDIKYWSARWDNDHKGMPEVKFDGIPCSLSVIGKKRFTDVAFVTVQYTVKEVLSKRERQFSNEASRVRNAQDKAAKQL